MSFHEDLLTRQRVPRQTFFDEYQGQTLQHGAKLKKLFLSGDREESSMTD
jgi:hypothetical protein